MSNQPQNLQTAICPTCPGFWDWSLAEESSKRTERLHPTTEGSRFRVLQPHIGKAHGEPKRKDWSKQVDHEYYKNTRTHAESTDWDSWGLREIR